MLIRIKSKNRYFTGFSRKKVLTDTDGYDYYCMKPSFSKKPKHFDDEEGMKLFRKLAVYRALSGAASLEAEYNKKHIFTSKPFPRLYNLYFNATELYPEVVAIKDEQVFDARPIPRAVFIKHWFSIHTQPYNLNEHLRKLFSRVKDEQYIGLSISNKTKQFLGQDKGYFIPITEDDMVMIKLLDKVVTFIDLDATCCIPYIPKGSVLNIGKKRIRDFAQTIR